MTAAHDGAIHGWPYSHYGQHVDERFKRQRPDLVARAIAPDYAPGAHTASLGLAHVRPVGVAFDAAGALRVADDVGNVVWRVTG